MKLAIEINVDAEMPSLDQIFQVILAQAPHAPRGERYKVYDMHGDPVGYWVVTSD